MYCKHCGKQIADDSTFCQYCGGKVMDESLLQESRTILPNDSVNESEGSTAEVVISTKEANPIQVELSKKGKDNSSTIANEIVGNLKMAGIAAALFAIYMIGFMLLHQKDITKYDYDTHTSYFGESCYDPTTLTGNWKFHWEEHYYETLYFRLHHNIPYTLQTPTPEQCLKNAEDLEEEINRKKATIAKVRGNRPVQKGIVTQADLEAFELESINFAVLRNQAKADAARDIQDWNDTINNHRRWGYEEDLKKNAIYAAIISLLVMILGRYLVKSVKWVNANKTS